MDKAALKAFRTKLVKARTGLYADAAGYVWLLLLLQGNDLPISKEIFGWRSKHIGKPGFLKKCQALFDNSISAIDAQIKALK